MHVAAFDREASLPGVQERSPNSRARGHVNIGIVEHQHGILAAQLELHGQQPFRRSRRNALARSHAAGKHQFVDRRTKQRGSGRAITHDNLRDILRDARGVLPLLGELVSVRPDMVVVEMGVPAWAPPPGIAYLASYGASRVCAEAVAEALGLT